MLFEGLMMQSEINCVLEELFDGLEGASLDEAEGAGLTRYEEREQENANQHAALLTLAA